MNKDGSFEFILKNTPEGIEIHIYKKYNTNKFVKIDFSIKRIPNFELMNRLPSEEIREIEEGLLFYNGKLTIYQLSNIMRNLKYKVGIDKEEISIEETIISLNKKMQKALNEEDYLECAKIRDELKRFENVKQ